MKFHFLILLLVCASAFAQTDTLWRELWIPVRTGDSLAADFYSLDSSVTKPTILIQTPYDKSVYRLASFVMDTTDTSTVWDLRHYNFVTLDWRGFYASADAGSTGYNRGLDGYDCVEWIASRSWSDSMVGTYGSSALGAIQFQTARQHPPHLVCAAPWIIDYKTEYADYYYGGVFMREHITYMEALGFLTVEAILAFPLYSVYWQWVENSTDYADEIAVPMLLVSGWFDHYPASVVRAFHDLRAESDIAVRDQHKLLMGPWTHSGVGKLVQGELEYPAAQNYEKPLVKKFFDYYLRGVPNGYDAEPVAQYFIMGSDEWLVSEDWYSIADCNDTFYLHPDGNLYPDVPPLWGTPPDTFAYDPRDPSPAYGANRFNPFDPGMVVGPRDIRDSVETRDDNLIYSTPVLTEPLCVVGRVKARLFVSSNCLDTDFAIRLCDVYPDGRSMVLSIGILRGRLRESLSTETLMSPGTVYEIEVETGAIAQIFLPGHRLRVVITSAIYPQFDRNLNNGGPMYEEGDTLIATNLIYHSEGTPSALILPVSTSIDVAERAPAIPNAFDIQIYPNPFNSSVTLIVDSQSESPEALSTLEIFDINGRIVAEIPANGSESAKPLSTNASGACRWQPDESLSSGVYLVRAKIGDKSVSKRIVFLK